MQAHDLPDSIAFAITTPGEDFRCVNKATLLASLAGIFDFGYKKGGEGRYNRCAVVRFHTSVPKLQTPSSQELFFNALKQAKPYQHSCQSQWPTPPPRRRASAPASALCSLISAPTVSARKTSARWNRTCAPTLPSRRNSRLSDAAAALIVVALRPHCRHRQSSFHQFTTRP